MIVTEQQRHGGPGYSAARPPSGLATCIASWSGEPEHVCVNPVSHPRSRANREARVGAERREPERDSRKAAKAPDVACQPRPRPPADGSSPH
jgi:hypothetical protein